MNHLIWLFPVLFILHDMEEIIGMELWLKVNDNKLRQKAPRLRKMYQNFSTAGMAVAVTEELLLCIVICLVAVLTENRYVVLIWFGGFFAYTLHLLIHLIQSIALRGYVPAMITSLLCLPVSSYLLYLSTTRISCSVSEYLIFSIIGILMVGINLKFAQSLIGKFTSWMLRKESEIRL